MSDTVWRSMTRGEYDTFAAEQRAAHGLPVAGIRADTGQPAPPGVGVTLDLYDPVVVDDGDVRIPLPADVVPTKVDRLGRVVETSKVVAEPVRKDDGTIDTTATRAADERAVVEREARTAGRL